MGIYKSLTYIMSVGIGNEVAQFRFLGKFGSNFGYSADIFDFWRQVRIDLVLKKGLGRFLKAPP